MNRTGSQKTVKHLAVVNKSAEDELRERVRQQEAVARLGFTALSGKELPGLLDEAVRVVAGTLDVGFVKVLEVMPDGERLLLRAGVGWRDGYVGHATVGTNLESQAGYTLISDAPVVSENLREEVRFKGAPLLHEHGITSGVTANIRVDGRHYGVIGAHTSRRRVFDASEVRFVQDVADVLGAAMRRDLADKRSRYALAELTERAEAAERRFEFLTESNALLSASPDRPTVLANAARLAIPELSEWCFVDLLQDGSTIQRTAAALRENGAIDLKESRRPLEAAANHGTPLVLKTGRPERLLDLAGLREHLGDDLPPDAGSFICVPLRVSQRTLGTMGFFSPWGTAYDGDDLTLCEGLAHCTALALDSTLHFVPDGPSENWADPSARREDLRAVVEGLNLTRRQLEVLRLLGDGKSARQISQELYRSEATVRNHIRAIKHALDARSQLEAVARARKLGLLSE
ncbi:GAF domain-containing protein [Rubrobacter tropicus]|uniref:GAF domain-containing protein n=1 Tax=Rubrobacter tropicus TaxID=2653851 RepID=A0A6G8Q4E2_9ACTN|nr:GAF domain-containing protein [Rubrobacter tropicus]QIN81335.1 GAF domain-containing protein [Rubrobacter tropicus]